jgi:dipeptidyl aminopeptidase/acylaminoacyl peptidase
MRRAAVLVAALVLLLGGCTDSEAGPGDPAASPAGVSSGSTSGAPLPSESPVATPTSSPTPTEEPLPEVHHRNSLPALMRQAPDGGRPRVLRTEVETADYTRLQVEYRSDDLTVSGVLLRPKGRGPFPAVVLNHGYIEPSIYVTGQGMAREQDALARAGYVVLHTDYRGHASGDPVDQDSRETRLGYTRDAVNAVDALEKLPYVDAERLGMVGRSMGGGVTMNVLVTQPGLVDAAVIYASVSSRFLDNLDHFTRESRPDAVETLFARYGTPRQNPRFYRELSPRTYFDRITEPVLAHHGTVDGTCPPPWARTTQRLMRDAEVDSRLRWWPGEDHAFYARWQDSMDETLRFLRRELRADL